MDQTSSTSFPTIINAATVICLRRASNTKCWQVLLGQNHVKNWYKSSEVKNVIMRYPGEWKFPGGVVEDLDYSFKVTAIRELNEEFPGLDVRIETAHLLLLNKKLTLPVKGHQYMMYNFVALEDDNIWINSDNASAINDYLNIKYQSFQDALATNHYWSLSDAEKQVLSPEVHCVEWLDIDEAIDMMSSSMFEPISYVNDWQRLEFEKYNITRRDPMYQSMVTLEEIKSLDTVENIRLKAISNDLIDIACSS